MTRKRCLLDSSFVIDLLNELERGVSGPAADWLRRNAKAQLWISPVTLTEVLEGARDQARTVAYLGEFRWQGIHRIHAEIAARLQRQTRQRLGENDAWQAAIVIHMCGVLVGHDPAAFTRLGPAYEDHRVSRQT